MKNRTLIFIFSTLFFLAVEGQVNVKGYYRSNGTYVAPHTRSSPNTSPYDNYSYPGNTNPYTGKTATGNPDTYINNLYNNKNTTSTSDVWVDGYYRSDGTYVTGHYRSAPNGNLSDNFSSPGKTNPYTSKTATGNSTAYGTTYYVSSNTLNLRSGPSTNYSILTSMSYGDDVEVLQTINSNWTKVRANSTIGYVYSSYLSFSNLSYSTSDYFLTPSTTFSKDFSNNYSNYEDDEIANQILEIRKKYKYIQEQKDYLIKRIIITNGSYEYGDCIVYTNARNEVVKLVTEVDPVGDFVMHREFFFDNGNLFFVYEEIKGVHGVGPSEFRYYINNGKLVKFLEKKSYYGSQSTLEDLLKDAKDLLEGSEKGIIVKPF